MKGSRFAGKLVGYLRHSSTDGRASTSTWKRCPRSQQWRLPIMQMLWQSALNSLGNSP